MSSDPRRHGGFDELATEWGKMPARRGLVQPDRYWENGRLAAERCLEALPPKTFPTIVELGCGHGRTTKWLAQAYERVYAVDIAQGMLDALDAPDNVTKVLDDGTHLVEKIGCADALFSYLVLMHNRHDDVARIMVEVGRLLSPGGRALVQIPVGTEGIEAGDWSKVGRWTVEQIGEIAVAAGLEPTIAKPNPTSGESSNASGARHSEELHLLDKPARASSGSERDDRRPQSASSP